MITSGAQVRLGAVTKLVRGISYKSSELTDTDNGVRMANLRNVGKGGGFRPDGYKQFTGTFKQEQVLQPGELLIANTDLSKAKDVLGAPFLVPHDSAGAVFSLDLTKIVPNEDILDRKYLYYFLQSPDARSFMKAHGQGITVMHLRMSSLPNLEIPVPSLDEQRRIVATLEDHLSRLDKALAELEHVSALTNRQTNSLIHHELARLKAEGTPMVPLADALEMQTGPAFQSKDFTEPSLGVRLLRGENIEPGALRWSNTKAWHHDKLAGFEKYFVQEGDLILAMDRPLVSAGLKLAPVKKEDLPCLLVQRVARMRANGKALTEYVYPFLLSLDFEEHLSLDATGTQIPHISMKGIGSFQIPLPPIERQREVAANLAEATHAVALVSETANQNRMKISNLRRSLLVSAFSGEL